jgi:hypothetical protein
MAARTVYHTPGLPGGGRIATRWRVAEASGRTGQRSWWGEFVIPHGQSGRWRIGPLLLVVSRLDHEWKIWRGTTGNPSDAEIALELPSAGEEPQTGAIVTRYGSSDETESLSLAPAMPDRAVVTRPEQSITVPPRQSVVVYVGSPLWLRVAVGAPKTMLSEFPVFQPQLTWWGPSTMDGETCYATRTHGRLRLEDVRAGPHRVMTAARIVNRARTPLLVERLNLPVRALSIYAESGSKRLWTESVTVERTEGEELAELAIGGGPGDDVENAVRVGEPRAAVAENQLFRAFGRLFR